MSTSHIFLVVILLTFSLPRRCFSDAPPSPSPSTSPSPVPSGDIPSPSPLHDSHSPPAPAPDLSSSPAPAPDSSPKDSPAPAPANETKTPAPAPVLPVDTKQNTADAGDLEAKDSETGLKSGQKAGIAIGVIAGIAVVGGGVLVYKKRQQNIQRARYGNLMAHDDSGRDFIEKKKAIFLTCKSSRNQEDDAVLNSCPKLKPANADLNSCPKPKPTKAKKALLMPRESPCSHQTPAVRGCLKRKPLNSIRSDSGMYFRAKCKTAKQQVQLIQAAKKMKNKKTNAKQQVQLILCKAFTTMARPRKRKFSNSASPMLNIGDHTRVDEPEYGRLVDEDDDDEDDDDQDRFEDDGFINDDIDGEEDEDDEDIGGGRHKKRRKIKRHLP